MVAIPAALAVARHPHRISPVALWLLPLGVALGLACRFVVLGYLRRVAQGAIAGTLDELPPWDVFGTDLAEGFKLWLLSLALFVPAATLVGAGILLMVAVGDTWMAWLPVLVLGPPLFLLTIAVLPAALLAAIDHNDLAAAFDVKAVWRVISSAFGPYVLAILVACVAEIVAQLGFLLCCVGVVLTRFLAHCVAAHAFATAYRSARLPQAPQPASQ